MLYFKQHTMAEFDWVTKFKKVYANLPFGAREEIVAVVNDQPFTWNSARIEIDNASPIGKQILESLIKLNILKKDE